MAKKNEIQIFELSNDPFIRRKQEMLSVPSVIEKMTKTEILVANASIKTPIKEMQTNDLAVKIIPLGKGILRDIGIKNWDDEAGNKYILIRFMDILSKYYETFTLSDVKLAFEFLSVGLLDEFLTKDKNGNAERSHYQDFSVEFYSKVLNAYKKYKSQVWSKAQSNLPRLEFKISDEQKKYNRNYMILEIQKAFDNFKEKGIEPNFDMATYIEILIEKDLVKIEKAQEESIKKAYNKLLFDGHLSRVQKKLMIDKFERRKMTPTLRINAQEVQNNKTIKEYFEKLIKEEKDIREFLTMQE